MEGATHRGLCPEREGSSAPGMSYLLHANQWLLCFVSPERISCPRTIQDAVERAEAGHHGDGNRRIRRPGASRPPLPLHHCGTKKNAFWDLAFRFLVPYFFFQLSVCFCLLKTLPPLPSLKIPQAGIRGRVGRFIPFSPLTGRKVWHSLPPPLPWSSNTRLSQSM